MRLIDADELGKKVDGFCEIGMPCYFKGQDVCKTCIVTKFRNAIDNAPTVETDIEVVAKDAYEQGYTDGWKERYGEPEERPQGEWIENLKTFCWECSICKNSALCNKIGVQVKSKSCPNCGADMRGKE